MDTNVVSQSPGNLAECRICHEEDKDSNMETPCSCRGSLEYSHRACVQRWCNEKGDIICEICHQQFNPDYTAPPPLLLYGGIPLNLRGGWEVSRNELNNNHLIPTVSSDENFMDPNFDEYSMLSSGSIMCCRAVTIIFVFLLVLRHTLTFAMYGPGEYSISWLTLVMLQTVGILLPIYIMAKALVVIQNRRSHQESFVFPSDSSDEENELRHQYPRSHLIHVP